jgi:hypothetical protein
MTTEDGPLRRPIRKFLRFIASAPRAPSTDCNAFVLPGSTMVRFSEARGSSGVSDLMVWRYSGPAVIIWWWW